MTIGYDPSWTSPSESPVFLSVSAARNAAYLASTAAWMKGAESSQMWVTKGVSSVCSSGKRGRKRPARGSKPLDPPAYGALPCTPPDPASYAASGVAREPSLRKEAQCTSGKWYVHYARSGAWVRDVGVTMVSQRHETETLPGPRGGEQGHDV